MKRLVIFDMDGTILDTLEDIKNSMNHALTCFGYPVRTLDEIRSFVGNGIRKLCERAVPSRTSEDIIGQVHQAFVEHYKAHSMDNTKPYDGIIWLLGTLRSRGYKTAVVSNKADFAVQDLAECFFDGLFDVAIGDRPEFAKKPAPDSCRAVMEMLGVSPEETVYVGDSEVDLATAENAGLAHIIVEWGFREKAFLKEQGAVCFAETPEDILTILEDNCGQP